MARSWYVIAGYSGYENRIEKNIRLMLEAGTLEKDAVFDVKVPVEKVSETRGGKARTQERKIFPGYVLVELDLTDANWKATCQAIRKINGVTGFLGAATSSRKPDPLPAEEARALLAKSVEAKGERAVTRSRTAFTTGEQVKITDGPFESFTGTIDEVNNDKTKLKVMVGIFGRNTPVEVDFTQVEKV